MRLMRTMRGELDKDDAVKADTERAAKLCRLHEALQPELPGRRVRRLHQSQAELHHEADRGVHRQRRKFRAGLLAELTLYAKQLAWLHAVPKAPAAQAVAKRSTGAADRSRLQVMKDEKRPVMLPEVPLSTSSPGSKTWGPR
jgi:hypothetical protein